jgi:hypothetical protein
MTETQIGFIFLILGSLIGVIMMYKNITSDNWWVFLITPIIPMGAVVTVYPLTQWIIYHLTGYPRDRLHDVIGVNK